MSAKFLVIEGIDGAGTTTQARLLTRWMNANGLPAVQTCEPTSGPIGTLIRKILQKRTRGVDPASLALLFAADRVDHVRHEIQPQLAKGIHVISDRYVFSSLAYQSLDLDLHWVERINSLAPSPDLTIYLRVPPALASTRRDRRGSPEEIFDADTLQQRIAMKYDELFYVQGDTTKNKLGPDPARIQLDPREGIRADPTRIQSGSAWIRGDPGEGIRVDPGGSGRELPLSRNFEVLDGSLSVESLNETIRHLVQEVAAGEKS